LGDPGYPGDGYHHAATDGWLIRVDEIVRRRKEA